MQQVSSRPLWPFLYQTSLWKRPPQKTEEGGSTTKTDTRRSAIAQTNQLNLAEHFEQTDADNNKQFYGPAVANEHTDEIAQTKEKEK